MDCVTPSHPEKIPHGESIDINALLDKGDLARLDPNITPRQRSSVDLDGIEYTPRIPVMATLDSTSDSAGSISFLKAQITGDDKELRDILKNAAKEEVSAPTMTAEQAAEEDFWRDESVKARLGRHYQSHAQLVEDTRMPVYDNSWIRERKAGGGATARRANTMRR